MGYSIFYDRAFIRVGEQYVPLVCSGASNGADRVGGRWVPEKDWSVLNWKRRDRVLFSEAEIREIAKDYEQSHQENGMSFRSRSKPFAPGGLEKWIIGGMKRAHTIEEYRSFGNTINVVDYPNGMAARWRRQPFTSDEELLTLISQFSAGQEFDIAFNGRDVCRPAKAQERGKASTPFAAIFGATGAPIPEVGRTENEKPSVLGMIAEAREDQRRAQAECRDKLSPDNKKTPRRKGEEL